MMKKTALILALVLLLSCLTGCGGGKATAPEGTTEELIGKIYENVSVELGLMTMPLDTSDPDALAYFTGLTSAEYITEGSVSEPMIGSQAYSLVLLRLNDPEHALAAATEMFDNIDTRKWVCVEATEKKAAVCGDLALFVMLDPQYGVTCSQIIDAFTTVCGGRLDSTIN